MTNQTFAALAAVAIIGAWAGSACFVDRKSDTLACTDNTNCTAPRVCEDGFCVIDNSACPTQCTSCDTSHSPKVCTVTGTNGASFTCPDNIKCVITCGAANACGNITCSSGSQCDITCSAAQACNDITCNGDSCVAKCTAANACGDVNCGGGSNGSCDIQCMASTACSSAKCTSSCKCDTTCSTADACGTIACPKKTGNTYCTSTGTQGDPCTSAPGGNCDSC